MNRETLADWCQRCIIGIILAALIYAPLAFGAVRPQEFQYLIAGAGLILLLWAARMWLQKDFRIQWPPAAWAVVAFIGYAIFAYAQAEVEYAARRDLIRALIYAVFFLAALNHTAGRETPQWIVLTLVAVGVGLTAYGLWQFVTKSNQVWFIAQPGVYARRATATYINPNHFAGFLEMVIPLALAFTIGSRLGHVMKIVLGYGALVMLVGQALTFSRGGWLSTACGIGVLVLIALWNPRLRLLAVGFAVLVVIVSSIFIDHSFTAQKRIEEASILTHNSSKGVRFMIWETAWEGWQTSPLTGIGPGHFDLRFREFRPVLLSGRPEYVHNDYLNTLTEWGIIGLVLATAFICLAALHLFQIWRGQQRQTVDIVASKSERRLTFSNRSAFVLGVMGSFVALLAHSVFDFNLQIPANALVLFVLLGTACGHLRYVTDRHELRGRTWAKVLLTLGFLGLSATGGATFKQMHDEETALVTARASRALNEDWRTAWRSAYEVEPKNFSTAQTLGEFYRRESWAGGDNYAESAVKAMEWFHRAVELNPYDGFSNMRIGMCLHWIGRHDEAAPFFERARELDPKGYFTIAHLGWHQFQLKNYPAAKSLFEQSLEVTPWGVTNETARAYLVLVEQRLKEPPGDYVPKFTPPTQPQ